MQYTGSFIQRGTNPAEYRTGRVEIAEDPNDPAHFRYRYTGGGYVWSEDSWDGVIDADGWQASVRSGYWLPEIPEYLQLEDGL